MARNSNILELNGRRYDARTGNLLQDVVREKAAHTTNLAPAKQSLQPIAKKPVMDGIVRSRTSAQTLQPHKQHKSQTLRRQVTSQTALSAAIIKPTPGPVKADVHPVRAHQPVKSETLMRHVVKKPAIARKPALKSQAHTGALVTTPKSSVIAYKKMSDNIDGGRLQRAVGTKQHQQVSRFVTSPRRLSDMAVQAVPSATSTAAIKASRPSAQPNDMFTRAIEHATSHEQTYKNPRHSRRLGRIMATASISLVILLFVGVVGYFNKNTIQTQMASAQAGFQVDRPSYVPAGYQLSNVSYKPGTAQLAYNATTYEGSLTLTEQPSSWNSQTLLESFVATSGQAYKTYLENGQTIYVFGDTATWVNGSMWYRLQTGGRTPSTSDLLQIAASL